MNQQPDARSKRPSGAVLVLAVVGAIALITALAFLALAIFALKSIPSSSRMGHGESRYLSQLGSEPVLAEIKLEGPIGPEKASEVIEKLDDALAENRIKGILFEINSPGGSVVASQEIYDSIARVKAKKPVVGYMREVAASGAYYSAVSANWLVANRGTMVGSIGVIFNSFEATQLVDWLKLKPVVIKTGSLKDSGSVVRPWTDDDKKYLQKLINDTRDQFVTDVRAARPQITEESINHMSDGRVVLGSEAAERSLVDEIGHRQTAVAKAAELAGLTTGADTEVIPMEEPEIPDFISSFLRGSVSTILSAFRSQMSLRQSTVLPELSSQLSDSISSESKSEH